MADHLQPTHSQFLSAIVRRRMRLFWTAVLGVTLLATLAGPAAGVERRERDLPEWEVTPEESVPVTDIPIIERGDDPAAAAAVEDVPEVSWPEAGEARISTVEPAADISKLSDAEPTAHAGDLPVWVRQTAEDAAASDKDGGAAAAPGGVDVELVGRQDDRLLLRVGRTDGVAKAATVSLGVEYEAFRHAYGGDWASRLHIVRLPDCAQRTPDADACLGTPVATHNDGSGRLWADVEAGAEPALYAIQAGPDGGTGAFSASTLSPAATWSVGNPSGDFNWSYPMDSPPTPAGPSPSVALAYSSGAVDGLTASTNNQPSWAGEGFDVTVGGSIERGYRQCSTDKGGNNGTRAVGDLCWATDNATLSLDGASGELIPDDDPETDVWHPRTDDGSKVERRTGANNGARNGEYWVVTAKDGAQYFFGLNRLPGWSAGDPETPADDDPVTNSTWTVPVFGNHAGEPCHASAFANSSCVQAYRWNLDYVVDPLGNAMAFFYDIEKNNYARNATATTVSSYVRAGNLNRIEYGHRDGAVYDSPAAARVVFDTEERCIPGSECTTSKPATYPDTPLDQACTSTSNCGTKFTPSFWTTKRLAKVSTQVRRGPEYADVESWTLRHSFPDPGDNTRPGLWLEEVTNAGHVGGTEDTPAVNFDGIQLANRVDNIGDSTPPMNWWRIAAVHYGTGGALAVKYSEADCAPGDVPAEPAANGRRCFPVQWTPEGQAKRQDWFHKYVVTEVTESDLVTGQEPVVTTVDYLSPAAWRFDEEDGLVDIDRKTWSKWRGYEHIRVTKGRADGTQSVTEQRYFRGMDGDRTKSGGQKDVEITDSTGTSVPDSEALAGQAREEITYDGNTIVNRTITDHWVSEPTATKENPWGTRHAYLTEERALQQDEADDGGRRRSGSENTYDADGVLTMSADLGDLDDPDDDTCTRYEYTGDPDVGIAELPARQQTVSVDCDKGWTTDDVIADERLYYDGADSPFDPPTRGEVTNVERLSGFAADGTPEYQIVAAMTYDALGRETSLTDAEDRTTKMAYTPSTGGPLTKAVLTKPNGSTVTELYEPAWGQEIAIVDEAGLRTDIAYDPLGRAAAVWEPGQEKGSDTPTMAYEYELRTDQANVVTTKTLQADGSVETVYEFTDGLLRPRQTQQPAPGGGRLIHDTFYDSRGLPVKENGPFYNDAAPTTEGPLPSADDEALPTQTVTTYDAAERATMETLYSKGNMVQRTRHTHAAGRHTVTPPDGEAPETTFTNVHGQVTGMRQFTGDTPTGDFDETTYAYTPAGELASVTDPAGNTWRFEYDIRGRRIAEHDPDKGTTRYTYDDADQLVSTTDARDVTLAYAYDELGRKVGMHEESVDGPKLTEWVYDTLAKGRLTSSTRWVDGEPYITRVTGYDEGGRPEGTEVVIPASEGELAGTYPVAHTYTESGEVASTRLPEAGDLPAETLEFGYNAQDLPTTLSSELGTYVNETEYTSFGEVSSFKMEHAGGYFLTHKYEYDTATRRLSRVVTERELSPRRVANVAYTYDPSGNITKITDEPAPGFNEPTDTQCFTYDHLRRLTAAWTPGDSNCAATPTVGGLGGPAPYWHEWTFDKVGNRQSETRRSEAGTTTSTYSYPEADEDQPHALLDVTTTAPDGSSGTNSYAYDATGNLAERQIGGTTEAFTWDSEGNLTEVASDEQSTSFVYDADGNRLIRRDSTGATLYIEQTEILLKPDGSLAGTRYYAHGEQVVASRTSDGLVWLGADHHGTDHIAIDAESQQVQRRRTDPYGNIRGAAPAAWPNQRGFVGGIQDPGTGLTHLEAREYDSTTGRFISVDPVADYSDSQQINGYAYANNSPVTFSDPDGNIAFIAVVVIGVRLVPVVSRVVKLVPTAVRYLAPVVRKVATTVVSKIKSFFSWLVSKITTVIKTFWRSVTTWVTRVKTVIKRTVETVKKMKRVQTKTVKRVPVKPKKVAKKPASKAKAQRAKSKAQAKQKAAHKSNDKAKRAAERQAKKANKKVAQAVRRAVRRGPQPKEQNPGRGPTTERRRVDPEGRAEEFLRDVEEPPDLDPYSRAAKEEAPKGGRVSRAFQAFIHALRVLKGLGS